MEMSMTTLNGFYLYQSSKCSNCPRWCINRL